MNKMSGTFSSLSCFRGVWQRTELYEPRGQLGPDDERKKIVIWIQSSCGLFIDIRVCPNEKDNGNVLNLKSFAGQGEYDSSQQYFTWTRSMDFRPPGTPDIGLMSFISPLVVEEDGVLPGDDFKEIWTQISPQSEVEMYYDFACNIQTKDEERSGFFLVVGEYFAFSLTRSSDSFTVDQLKSIFDGETAVDEGEKDKLLKYICCIGKISDWKVLYSLDLRFVGNTILNDEGVSSELDDILRSLRFDVIHGDPPDHISSLLT